MKDIKIEQIIGNRLRQARSSRGLNLEDVAKPAGMTAASLSKIENGKVSSPISTYYKLASALGITFDKIVGGMSDAGCLVVRKDDAKIKSKERTGYGYKYEILGSNWSGEGLNPYLLTYEVRPNNAPKPEFTFDGQEFIYVLEGELDFFSGKERHLLKPGDCVFVNGNIPHGGQAHGGTEAKALLFSTTNPNTPG